ncbi:Uncharacterised protein [Mycolicibacterium flavescens]|nr:Uncharacterised protein [Mycolicibacterium flavescens]
MDQRHSLRHWQIHSWQAVATWYFIPWLALAVFAVPILLVDLAIGVVLMTRAGVRGQIGRGMLIGLIAAPLTVLLFLPGLLLVQGLP